MSSRMSSIRFQNRVPSSKHTLFMRGFNLKTDVQDIVKFFKDIGECTYDCFRHSKGGDKMNIAIRFKSRDVAREVITKWNYKEVLGSKISITWYKDYRAARRRAALEARARNPVTQSTADRLRAKYRKNMKDISSRARRKVKDRSRSRSRSLSPRQPHHRRRKRKSSLSPKLPDFRTRPSYRKIRRISVSPIRSRIRSTSSSGRLSADRHKSREKSMESRTHSPKSKASHSRSKSPDVNGGRQQFSPSHAIRVNTMPHAQATEYSIKSPIKSKGPASLYEEAVIAHKIRALIPNGDDNVTDKECVVKTKEENKYSPDGSALYGNGNATYGKQQPNEAYGSQSELTYPAKADENHNQVNIDSTEKNEVTDHHVPRSCTPPTPTQDEISNMKPYNGVNWSDTYTHSAITGQDESDHGDVDYRKGRDGRSRLGKSAEEIDTTSGSGAGPSTDLGMSPRCIEKIKVKKEQLERAYRQDCETFATVVKMLISKEPCLESLVQHSLKENLKEMGMKCINELQQFIHSMREDEKMELVNNCQ